MGSLESGAKRKAKRSVPLPLFPARSPNAPTHCFLLTMKNRDLFGSVLIDSRGMDLPKQKIRLPENISCRLREGKLERPFAISKASRQRLSPSITHSLSKQSERHDAPELYTELYPRIPGKNLRFLSGFLSLLFRIKFGPPKMCPVELSVLFWEA